jgi:energy-coupling factor transporter ATP-binding protein EcfA2
LIILIITKINILLLGETGVGKSTFINAFANYLAYETLEQALANKVISLIPSSFIVTDENYERVHVKYGQDDNEQEGTGVSATQKCKSYCMPFGERFIRLIDTPGFGDTEGIEKDKDNFVDIINYIDQFPLLHCVCILLKPNNARLTMVFEYCIKQLLMNLPISMSKNIVFVFTNTRGSFYRPGDTGPALVSLLKQMNGHNQDNKCCPPSVDICFSKSTVYCFDSEGFRYIVAKDQGIGFEEYEVIDFGKSWSMSAIETKRLLKYIIGYDGQSGLTPHPTRDAKSVNRARRILSDIVPDMIENTINNLVNYDESLKQIEITKEKITKVKVNILKSDHAKILCKKCEKNEHVCDKTDRVKYK